MGILRLNTLNHNSHCHILGHCFSMGFSFQCFRALGASTSSLSAINEVTESSEFPRESWGVQESLCIYGGPYICPVQFLSRPPPPSSFITRSGSEHICLNPQTCQTFAGFKLIFFFKGVFQVFCDLNNEDITQCTLLIKVRAYNFRRC